MLRRGIDRLRQRLIDNLPYEYRAKLVNWCLQLSTYRVRGRLASSAPIEILVDNSVLGHGSTHKTVEVVQKVNWPPGSEPGEVTVAYRTPRECNGEVYENLRYLPGIAHLTRGGYLKLKTSFELLSERNHHPIGRFTGNKTLFSYWLFDGIKIESVDGYDIPDFDRDHFRKNPTINKIIYSKDVDPLDMYPNNKEKQISRVSQSTDPLYMGLANLMPKKGNLDAWHIRTAEAHGLFCFLTMDFRLRRNVEQNRLKEPIASLHSKVMTPKEFGKHIGVSPINPYICELTENDAVKSSARLRKEFRSR